MPRRILLLAPALILAGLGVACEDYSLREERRALMAVDKGFSDRIARDGLKVMEDYFDEDAITMPAYGPIVEGREHILAGTYRPLYDIPGVKLVWTPTRAEVSRSRDLGWTLGTYTYSGPNAKGETIERRGRYITIWRKQRDGTWKAVLDSGNPDQPRREAPAGPEAPAPAPGTAAPGASPPQDNS